MDQQDLPVLQSTSTLTVRTMWACKIHQSHISNYLHCLENCLGMGTGWYRYIRYEYRVGIVSEQLYVGHCCDVKCTGGTFIVKRAQFVYAEVCVVLQVVHTVRLLQ